MAGYKSSFDKWFWRFDRLLIVALALPVVGLFALFIREGHKAEEALKRARVIPVAERRSIVEHCVKLSASIKGYHDLRFDEDPKGHAGIQPIPPEFAALQPMRVTVGKASALFILQVFVDSGVSINCSGLDTPSPLVTLSWGEGEGRETW
ncbi:MAG: hypothetical protein EOP84_19730 [Verrucomicrobiaceae bacterium]|nr:MAG: hypothetical protein EOP84_19730 [Verrucomicrobiaceae bacterium]